MENEQNEIFTEFDTDLDNGFKMDYKNQILKIMPNLLIGKNL